MKSTRQRSVELERKVLQQLKRPPKRETLPSIAARQFVIVSPEYREGAEKLDRGEGWHDLSAEDQRACQIMFATLELRDSLRRITGVTLPIVRAPVPKRTNIELVAGEEDGFEVVRPESRRVVLRGKLLYAVHHFLECQGCRWYGLGAGEQIVPQCKTILLPKPSKQTPSFPMRLFHSHLENRATASMLDWFGKNRLNLWGADNDHPGQRSRGIQIYGGNHSLIHRAGFEKNFDISDPKQRGKLLDAVVELYGKGHYRDVDIVDYIGEDWAKRVDSPGMRKLGSPSDQDVFLLAEIQKAVDARLNRKLGTWGWAYYDTIQPPKKKLPDGFTAAMGLWSMSDPRFAIDDPASDHRFEWPGQVAETTVQHFRLSSNIELWRAFCGWPCPMGMGDYFAMARNAFLPAPFVTVLADTLPKLAKKQTLYFSFMHIANGYWGLMQPVCYLMARLLWDAKTDVAATLAGMLRDQFGKHAPAAARCLFAMERAMLPNFWIRSYVAKRLALVTLHDKNEEFWCWRDHFTREEFLHVSADLGVARDEVKKLEGSKHARLWEEQIEYADAMHQLYVHVVEAYESARKDGRWHFSKAAAQHFTLAVEQLRRLASVDLPRWSRNVHYYPRTLLEQTCIGDALKRMSANLGIPLPTESSSSSSSSPFNVVWTHGGERPLQVGLGNYQWAQPYVSGHRVFVTGQDKESSPHRSILRCLDLEDGTVVWEHVCEDAGYSALLSTYLGVESHSVIVRECHKNPERSSALIRFDAATGREIWRVEDAPEWQFGGNGAALVLDLDQDGRLEVIDSAVAHIACIDLETGKTKWRYADQIKICHGNTAVGDVDGDGRLELAIGGEYNECGKTSSIQVLRDDGTLLWKNGGHSHDLGSTRSFIMDVDGDGKMEVLHSSLELLNERRLPTSDFYCWNADGSLRYRVPFGCREASLADFDGDGIAEAIGITSGRDGGFATKPAIVCLDAATGKEKWRTSIPRHYLDDDQRVIADFDGDGLPEALLFTAHQSGYGHVPGQPTWGDAYIVKGNGKIIWQADVGDLGYAVLLGTPEKPESVVIATGDGLIRRLSVSL